MASHSFRLHDGPFKQIASGRKTVEARLYDTKRQTVKLGDEITFSNRGDGQLLSAVVIGLLRYATFSDLFSHNDPAKFDAQSSTLLEKQSREFYSLEDQKQNGVIGIEFTLV